jgi:hypothetical protein
VTERPDSFFIGWAPPPRPLRGFLIGMVIGLVALFALTSYLTAATQDDPGGGAFRSDWGRETVVGVLQAEPYPVLHVLESERFGQGHALMLSGFGKRGVQDRGGLLDGKVVEASGVALKRGALDMLQVRGGAEGLGPLEGREAPLPPVVSLGRWRITGEICDGKCYAGAMRPSQGLAHKACANLCLIGGVPPVFVATDEIEGQRFFLLANAKGGAVTEAILDQTATLVETEGEVTRRGALFVFNIDPQTIRLAQ